MSSVPISIEGYYDSVNRWAPLVPLIPPSTEHNPFAGALWLPKEVILRSVNSETKEVLTVFGAVGNGITVVQPP